MSVEVQACRNAFFDLVLNDHKPSPRTKTARTITPMLYLSIRPRPAQKGGPSKSGDDDDGTQPKGGS